MIIREPLYICHYFFYVGTQAWNNANQNFAYRDLIQNFFSPEIIAEGTPEGDNAFSHLVVVLEERCGPIDCYYNKYFASAVSQARHAFAVFKSKSIVFSHVGGPAAPSDPAPSALYVKRGPPRTFSPELEQLFLQKFSDYRMPLEAIDFSAMTWSEQVKSTARAQLMVGIHGNGLTNCLWMPAGATLIEFFPAGVHHYDYQLLAEVADLNYFGIEASAENPFVFTDGSRFGSPYGFVNEPVVDLPWPWLDQILEGLIRSAHMYPSGEHRGATVRTLMT